MFGVTFIGFVILYTNIVESDRPSKEYGGSRCERIQIPLCRDAPYNFTKMPNLFDHQDQQAAALSLAEYNMLVMGARCSEHLKFFLCSLYAPMCTETVDVVVTSCRAVCEKVEASCSPLFRSFGLPWPEALNCSKFPVAGRGTLCMDPDSSSPSEANFGKNFQGVPFPLDKRSSFNDMAMDNDMICAESILERENVADPHSQCVLKCDRDWMFDGESKRFAQTWMMSWATLCFLVTFFTVVTFCLDRSRFRYPERPIIFLSFCYNVYAFGYLPFYFFNPEAVKCHRINDGRSILISGGMENSYCIITFTILYYFSMASVVWWVLLSLAWYLAAARKWGREAIADISQFFHLAAWGLPALLTIAVMTTHSVDASEITGLCYVGQQNPSALLGFLIIPLALFFVIGVGFITAGLLAMGNIRAAMKMQERSTDLVKLEKLMARIAIFSILYGIPTFVVLCCYIYEYFYLELWAARKSCQKSLAGIREENFLATSRNTNVTCRHFYETRPSAEVYMLKIFMTLVVGITSGMWIISRKTLAVWRTIFCCCCCFRPKTPGSKFVSYGGSVNDGRAAGHQHHGSNLPLANSVVAPFSKNYGHNRNNNCNKALLQSADV